MGAPRANQDLSVCYGEKRRYELPNLGTQNKRFNCLFWESGNISRPNDDAVIGQCDLIVERDVIGQCNLVTERDATGELALLGGECGVPRANQDFICLLWGKAEVHVAQ